MHEVEAFSNYFYMFYRFHLVLLGRSLYTTTKCNQYSDTKLTIHQLKTNVKQKVRSGVRKCVSTTIQQCVLQKACFLLEKCKN